jgi:hypothetical protein
MAALLFFCLPASGVHAQDTPPAVTVEGTSFVLRAAGGRLLRSPDLTGAVLGIEIGGRLARVRIDHVERDPDALRQDVWLHHFSIQQADGAWQPLCAAGPDGRTQGFPLAGRTLPNGTLDRRDLSTFELACSAGAQAKCVRYGYAPWGLAPDGTSLHAAHSACVTMLRGDHAGDGSATTSDGTLVGITDRWKLRALEPRAGHPFEAGWVAEGAVCVHHARIRGTVDLAALEARVPRLKGRTGAACTPELARSLGALILNWSRAE